MALTAKTAISPLEEAVAVAAVVKAAQEASHPAAALGEATVSVLSLAVEQVVMVVLLIREEALAPAFGEAVVVAAAAEQMVELLAPMEMQ